MGGINDINIYPYLNHEKIIGIGSSWVANETLINDSNWKEIERKKSKIIIRNIVLLITLIY